MDRLINYRHAPIVVAVLVVVFRTSVWSIWEQSYFDSDQAITGLMAKHLWEGRAWPLIFYGQHYMLGVESWLAAPFVGLLGSSVLSLRLPLIAINIVIAILLIRVLARDGGLRPWPALLAALFFLMPSPVASARFVEASGVAIEPFLYSLLLWLTRGRPVWFGLIAGVGIMNREFTVYAVAAVWLLELLHGEFFRPARLRAKLIVVAEVAAIAVLVAFLKPHADLVGPGTAGTLGDAVAGGQARFLASRFCVNPSEFGANFRWLFEQNLASLFGWRVGPYRPLFESALSGGSSWVWIPLALACAAGLVAAFVPHPHDSDRRGPRTGGVPGAAFPFFLILVGLQAALVYASITCFVRDPTLVRYTLLAVFAPVGFVALALRSQSRVLARLVAAATALFVSVCAIEQARVTREYIVAPPPNDYRLLADYLVREGIRYGSAPYWTAYKIDFLTGERVVLTAYDKVRVQEYDDLAASHMDQTVGVFVDQPCTDPGAVVVSRWCLLYVDRARNAR